MRRLQIALALGIASLVLVVSLSIHPQGNLPLSVAGRLLFGWLTYLVEILPLITISRDGVATALVSLALFTLGFHAFLRWFHREVRRQTKPSEPPGPPWPMRRTIALVLGVIVMFVAGIAATGIAHQAGWILATENAWASVRRATWSYRNDRGQSNVQLSAIGMGIASYASVHDQFPSTLYDEQHSRALHSWQLFLLPYMWQASLTASMIDYKQPWDSPRNSAYFRGIMVEYLNPEITPIRSPAGHALSHYAGNPHVLDGRQSLRLPESSQSSSASLIMAGEVNEGFKPWGDPTNLRDPARGTKGGTEGYGNVSGTGANFVFADGSVRFLSRTTNPQILARHSLPDPRLLKAPKPTPNPTESRQGIATDTP